MESIKGLIREVPDWPQKGILFKDITPLFRSPEGLASVVDGFFAHCRDLSIDVVAGIEARGFWLAPILAWKLGRGFVPLRKKGKLPAHTFSRDYQLEYGAECLEIHTDALQEGRRVLLVDDLLATGGTALAAAELIREAGGVLEAVGFVVHLSFLEGGERLAERGVNYFSLTEYSS